MRLQTMSCASMIVETAAWTLHPAKYFALIVYANLKVSRWIICEQSLNQGFLLVDDSEQADKFSKEKVAHFELGVSGWQEPTEAIKSWDNVVSIKVCSELCLTANSSRINSWIFDSPNSNCTCLDLPPNYQCRQWFGKSVSLEDIEMPDVSFFVMESRAPLKTDCTGELF